MKYAILIYDSEESLSKMAESMDEEYEKFATSLVETDRMRGGEQLAPPSSATTLTNERGQVIPHDGPFAETKEQLGGFFLIEAGSLDDALEIAGRVPSLGYGGVVEVRPITENMEQH
jgi:hypothetical protein